jgi:hypothetical protein
MKKLMSAMAHLGKAATILIAVVIAANCVSCNRSEIQKVVVDSLELQLDANRVLLPNGWSLSPAGKKLPLGDLPLNLLVSPTGKFIAITNNGQSKQSIMLLDPVSESIIDSV